MAVKSNGWLKALGGALIGVAASITFFAVNRVDKKIETAEHRGASGAALAATVSNHERRLTDHEKWAERVYTETISENRKTNERLAALETRVADLQDHLVTVPGKMDKLVGQQSEILHRLRRGGP